MRILPPTSKLFSRAGLIVFSAIFWAGLVWTLHFIFEFSVIVSNGLPIALVVAHYLGVSIGALFGLKFGKRWNPFSGLIICSGLMVFFFICLVIITQQWFIFLCLFGAGFFIGASFGFIQLMLSFFLDDPKYNGRIYGLGFGLVAVIILTGTLVDLAANIWLYISFFLTLFLIIAIFILKGRDSINIPPQENLNLRKYFKRKENLPALALAFFAGFFFTNSYYSTILILEIKGWLIDHLNLFIIVLSVLLIVFYLSSGVLTDNFGRRSSILLGLSIQALAFLLLSFLELTLTLLVYIFPIILAIGLALTIVGAYTCFIELPEQKYLRDNGYIFIALLGLGCVGGVVLGEVLRQVIKIDPAYLTILLLFVFVVASFSISQVKETLPSRDELEWKGAIQYVYVLLRSGVPIYTQDLCEIQEGNYCVDDALLGGALVAVSSLLQEAARNKNPLKVVKQEGFTIIIEESPKILVAVISLKELNVIRQKAQAFLEEFQEFFGELLVGGPFDLRVFSPAKKLTEKHFS